MRRTTRLTTLAIVACVVLLLLGLSLYLHSWGGVALIVLGGAGFAWYRSQVVRSEQSEDFFGDLGEETRLTSFQGGSASELPPADRTVPGALPPERH